MAKKRPAPPNPAAEEAATVSPPESGQPPAFEESIERLEEIVQLLEQGNLSLDESLQLYQEGIARIGSCNEQLTKAERKIELLMGVGEEGEPQTRPFDEQDMSLEDKQMQRSRRRSLD